MVTREAKSEIVLQLLSMVKIIAMDVFPAGEHAEESVGTAAKFD